MQPIIVIGAGLGGLSAAVSLAAQNQKVIVLEALPSVGGKAGYQEVDGVSFDTGPSVITLPHVFDELFQAAGTRLKDELELLQPDPFVRYLFDDQTSVDFYHSRDETLESVQSSLGSTARDELERFLAYAKQIWDIAAPPFVYGAAPNVGRVVSFGPKYWAQLPRIDATRTMWKAIQAQIRDPKLRAILARFATYNGSDARQAPATLNCIAHVEITLGGFGIKGGVQSIIEALERITTALGVDIRTSCPVERIDIHQKAVRGVHLADGSYLSCSNVVVNADVGHLLGHLVDKPIRGISPIDTPSMSGWTGVFSAAPNPVRAAHTVLMSDPYIREFEDIFDKDKPPEQPTVYLCDQRLAHGRSGWGDRVPVFAMANTPAEPLTSRPKATWTSLMDSVCQRTRHSGALMESDPLIWQRTPADLAELFPGTRGAIYGAASHGMMSSFRRPSNEIRSIKGLYLASGSAHPGGGMPLAVLSGRAAATALLKQGK